MEVRFNQQEMLLTNEMINTFPETQKGQSWIEIGKMDLK
jgi:hypothetical protein